jgi:hypothetical protein
MSESTKLTEQELFDIRSLNTQYNQIKNDLGNIEISKAGILKKLDELQEQFRLNEQLLTTKYGADAVINIQTGDVTKKQK